MSWQREASGRCACGSEAPRIRRIEGRVLDYMWSGERGPIYLGNISNCVKQAPGVRRFQVVQKAADQVLVKLVVDPAIHNIAERETLLREFVDRLGAKVSVAFQYVDDIPREPNGKYRIVKNLLTSPRD